MSFKPDPMFNSRVEKTAGYKRGVNHVAEAVGEQARRNVRQAKGPWIPRKGHRDPIVVEGNRITNTDHGWHLLEFGSVKSPVWAPLRRAVRAVGLKLKD